MRTASATGKGAADTTADRKRRIPAKPRRMATLDLWCKSVFAQTRLQAFVDLAIASLINERQKLHPLGTGDQCVDVSRF